MKQLHITIDPLGNPSIEAKGFSGSECKAATKDIEALLAGSGGVISVEHKPEYNAPTPVNQKQQTQRW